MFCLVVTLRREKTRFLIMGWLFWGSGGCRRWAGGPGYTGGNNGATVQPNTLAPVRKVQRGVFSTFLFPRSGIITRGNKEPFKHACSPRHSPGGAACTHACQLSAGCEGTVTMHTNESSSAGPVTLGSGVGTIPGWVPSSPGSHGRGRGALLSALGGAQPGTWLWEQRGNLALPPRTDPALVNEAVSRSGFNKAPFLLPPQCLGPCVGAPASSLAGHWSGARRGLLPSFLGVGGRDWQPPSSVPGVSHQPRSLGRIPAPGSLPANGFALVQAVLTHQSCSNSLPLCFFPARARCSAHTPKSRCCPGPRPGPGLCSGCREQGSIAAGSRTSSCWLLLPAAVLAEPCAHPDTPVASRDQLGWAVPARPDAEVRGTDGGVRGFIPSQTSPGQGHGGACCQHSRGADTLRTVLPAPRGAHSKATLG